jgi:hypothetical protein
LQRYGLLDDSGRLTIDDADSLPPEMQERLEDLVENLTELKGLLKLPAMHAKANHFLLLY